MCQSQRRSTQPWQLSQLLALLKGLLYPLISKISSSTSNVWLSWVPLCIVRRVSRTWDHWRDHLIWRARISKVTSIRIRRAMILIFIRSLDKCTNRSLFRSIRIIWQIADPKLSWATNKRGIMDYKSKIKSPVTLKSKITTKQWTLIK